MSDLADDRWQTKITSLKQGIQHIYKTKEFSDVTFKIGQKRIKAHRLVLAARSSEFGRKLLDPNAVDVVIVDDECVTETGFEILLRFIYLDSLGTEDKASVVEAYSAAIFYKQKALQTRCEEIMDSWIIDITEVCTLLNVSLNIPQLKEKCLSFIRDSAVEVIASSDFFNLNFNSLAAILENDALADIPILQRLKRIMEWGADRHTKPVNYKHVREDFLFVKPSLLGMLGLDTLSLEELSNVVATYKNLLTPIEVCSFMEHYNSKDKSVLPEWSKTC